MKNASLPASVTSVSEGTRWEREREGGGGGEDGNRAAALPRPGGALWVV